MPPCLTPSALFNPARHAHRCRCMPGHAVRELLDFPFGWLSDLPEAIRFPVWVAGAPVPIVFDTTPQTSDAPVLATHIVFERDELRALAAGVQADRVWHREFLGFCFEKWRRPSFRVGLLDALAGATADDEQPAWSVERVLRRLQASLDATERGTHALPSLAWSVAA
jgi:hypothetical protein